MVVGTIALLEMQCNPVLKTIEVSTHPDSTTCTLNMCLCLTEYSKVSVEQKSPRPAALLVSCVMLLLQKINIYFYYFPVVISHANIWSVFCWSIDY